MGIWLWVSLPGKHLEIVSHASVKKRGDNPKANWIPVRGGKKVPLDFGTLRFDLEM